MERTFKWQDLANKFRQIAFCLTFLLFFGITIGLSLIHISEPTRPY